MNVNQVIFSTELDLAKNIDLNDCSACHHNCE